MAKAAISMRELQKMSASMIRDLRGTTPIKSGDETVALLTPIKDPDPERLAAVLRQMDEHYEPLSPEEKREIEALVGELED